MAATYTGVLTGGRIEWTGGVQPPDGPVRVEARDEPAADAEWRAAVAHLAAIAARGDLDPVAWERWREECERGGPEVGP